MLRVLKRHCLPSRDMLTIYEGYIRPVLEYGTPVWHSGITQKQSENIEKIQKRALRIIFGCQYSTYCDTLAQLGMITLQERRRMLCLNFIQKTLNNTDQFKNYLPQKPRNERLLRHSQKIPDFFCRTNRMKNSPLPFLIRLYNTQ